jgi:hypothetical protein
MPDSLTLLDVLALPFGFASAWAYVAYARRLGDRELQVLASGLVLAALVYVIAALVQGATEVVLLELAGAAVFGLFAALGLRKASVWLAIGWYAITCLAFDVVVAAAILRVHPLVSISGRAETR